MASTRLRPNEASALLKEDSQEFRVGGISLQVIAELRRSSPSPPPPSSPAKNRRKPHDAHSKGGTDETAGDLRTALATLHGGVPGERMGRPGRALMGRVESSIHEDAGAKPSPLHSSPGAVAPETVAPTTTGPGTTATRRSVGPRAVAGKAPSLDRQLTTGVGRDQAGQPKSGGTRMGLSRALGKGRARRFQIPRPSGNAVAAGPAGDGSSSGKETRSHTSTTAVPGGGKPRTPSRAAGTGSQAGAAVVIDPGDVVLEWTKAEPPQPIRVGVTLARRLHPHQREGLKVLWECLAGRGG